MPRRPHKRKSETLSLAAGVVSLLLAPAVAVADAQEIHKAGLPGAQAHSKLKKIEDLPNFHAVHPYLFRSGEPTEAGLRTAHDKYGIKTLIDLRAAPRDINFERAIADRLGMTYINLPMSDKPPTQAQVATLMKTLRAARDSKPLEPVLVHCAHGSDRTGCMIGIWRVTEDGYDYDRAYKEMRKYWFTPKFVKLSGSVREAADAAARKQLSVKTN